jgi:hypothetical protein
MTVGFSKHPKDQQMKPITCPQFEEDQPTSFFIGQLPQKGR